MTRPDVPSVLLTAALALTPIAVACADGPTPAEAEAALLRLVPADAGLTISLVDLRGDAREIIDSRLAQAFRALPAVKDWRGSEAGRKFTQARAHIERALGVPLSTVRDDLLGDAVVLTLHLAPGAPPDSARGLLLARVRDRALLQRLIDLANGRDVEVSEEGPEGRRYFVRKFPRGQKATEYYRLFDDGTFAWSNSEALIRGVIDQGGGATLGDDPAFRKTRQGLPARSLITVHLDPKFITRVLDSAPKSGDAGDRRAVELIGRFLHAVDGIGLAIEWRDGLRLHAHETFAPGVMDPRFARWAHAAGAPSALARRIPGTAVVVAAAPIEFATAFEALVSLVPDADRPRLELVLEAVRGVLLGSDLRSDILPHVGPGVVAYVEEASGDSSSLPLVAAVELRDAGGERGAAAALDNALRTLLCLHALDPRHGAAGQRIDTRKAGPLQVTTLDGLRAPFAYGIGIDCLLLGTSSDAVARFGTAPADSRLGAIQAASFPDARAYVSVDVARLVRVARARREPLTRHIAASRGITPETAARDLDRALALLDLFEVAFAALAVDPDGGSAHQTLGLIGR